MYPSRCSFIVCLPKSIDVGSENVNKSSPDSTGVMSHTTCDEQAVVTVQAPEKESGILDVHLSEVLAFAELEAERRKSCSPELHWTPN
jgi:hypothetical protein